MDGRLTLSDRRGAGGKHEAPHVLATGSLQKVERTESVYLKVVSRIFYGGRHSGLSGQVYDGVGPRGCTLNQLGITNVPDNELNTSLLRDLIYNLRRTLLEGGNISQITPTANGQVVKDANCVLTVVYKLSDQICPNESAATGN
jgi:hypothetical protein